MADFCKQCSEDLFGEDHEELARLCDENETCRTICEGCGFISVDHEGRCVDTTCKEHGNGKV